MKRTALVALILAMIPWTPVWAQADFSTIRLEPGDHARVLQRSGTEVGGVVTDVAPGHITIGEFTFAPDAVLKIDRAGDSIFTGGTLVGMGIGAVLGGTIPYCGRSRADCVFGTAIGYGALGFLIDILHPGQTTVFRSQSRKARAVAMAPMISPQRKAVVVSLGF